MPMFPTLPGEGGEIGGGATAGTEITPDSVITGEEVTLITVSTKINTEANQEVAARTQGTGTGDGIRRGRTRFFVEDSRNNATRLDIQTEVERATAVAEVAVSTPEETREQTALASTPEQVVESLEAATFQSPKTDADLTRSLQNLQRRCNHQFSLATGRCNLCGRKRISHVYDGDRGINPA